MPQVVDPPPIDARSFERRVPIADGGVELLCECRRPECMATFALIEAQFDGLLGNGDRVVVANEHRSEANCHRILAEYDGFLVVAAAEPEALAS